MTVLADEETPLLVSEQGKKKTPTPLPWAQFGIILFLQLAEPLTSQVIYPFAPQLIRDLGVTHGDEARVGYYVGMMQSLFFATQAMTVLHWSRLSDSIGRKPVIMIGLFGLSLSMYSFGLSKTFWGLVIRFVHILRFGSLRLLTGPFHHVKPVSQWSSQWKYWGLEITCF